MVALLLESDEIKNLKPIYNVLQKKARAVPFFGIFNQYDQYGYIQFSIRKLKEGDEPLSTADSMSAAKDVLHRMVEHHQLCQSKCDLHQMPGPCFHFHLHKCKGACSGSEAPELYNERAIEAIKRYSFHLESFFIVGKGRAVEERSIICIEKGQYKGFGYTDISISEPEPLQLREQIKSYPHNRDIQQILCTYLKRNHKKLSYDA